MILKVHVYTIYFVELLSSLWSVVCFCSVMFDVLYLLLMFVLDVCTISNCKVSKFFISGSISSVQFSLFPLYQLNIEENMQRKNEEAYCFLVPLFSLWNPTVSWTTVHFQSILVLKSEMRNMRSHIRGSWPLFSINTIEWGRCFAHKIKLYNLYWKRASYNCSQFLFNQINFSYLQV